MDSSFPILVLEDNADEAFLLKRALKKNGIRNPTIVVGDGIEGIEYLTGVGKFADRKAYPLPGFIIADLKMPRLGGLEFLAWLRENEQFSVVPILVLSSSREDRDVTEAYALGANSYLVKPTQYEDFEELVGIVHSYWSLCVRPRDNAKLKPSEAKAA